MAGDEGVVTRSHVPDLREAVRSGCGKNFLFFTPRHMTPRAHPASIRMAFSNIARTAPPE
jgi:hypothetical protein